MNIGSIDLNDISSFCPSYWYNCPADWLTWSGSGSYNNIVYTTTQAFACGFYISSSNFDCWNGDGTCSPGGDGIDGIEIEFCHQDIWDF